MADKPANAAAALSANQEMNPTVLRPPASVTSVANQTSTFHAALLPVMSFHCTTPVSTISEMTTSATVVGSMNEPPKIHNASARITSPPMINSLRDRPPILPNSCPAHAGTSVPALISGGYSL